MSEYVADDDWSAVRRNFEKLDQILGALSQIPFFIGTGSPNTVVTASPPAIYFNRSGGASTTIYLKESGSATNTGWVAK
jgi:hypothetical protein